VGLAGLATLYCMIPLGVAGAAVLRRRRVPISPLVAPVLVATLSAMLAFGNPRYRASADIVVVVLAAAALEWFWTERIAARRGARLAAAQDACATDARLGAGPESSLRDEHSVSEGLH